MFTLSYYNNGAWLVVVKIKSFKNKATEEIAQNIHSKNARSLLPGMLFMAAIKKMKFLQAIPNSAELRKYKSLHFEALKGDRLGQFSIRINKQYRLCFRLEDEQIFDLEVVDYH